MMMMMIVSKTQHDFYIILAFYTQTKLMKLRFVAETVGSH